MDQHEREAIIDRMAKIDAELERIERHSGPGSVRRNVALRRQWSVLKKMLDAADESQSEGK